MNIAISSLVDVSDKRPSIHLGSWGKIRLPKGAISRVNANLDASLISNDDLKRSRATRTASAVCANSSEIISAGAVALGELFAGIPSEKPRARVPKAIIKWWTCRVARLSPALAWLRCASKSENSGLAIDLTSNTCFSAGIARAEEMQPMAS